VSITDERFAEITASLKNTRPGDADPDVTDLYDEVVRLRAMIDEREVCRGCGRDYNDFAEGGRRARCEPHRECLACCGCLVGGLA
jgi:hypothetical protein